MLTPLSTDCPTEQKRQTSANLQWNDEFSFTNQTNRSTYQNQFSHIRTGVVAQKYTQRASKYFRFDKNFNSSLRQFRIFRMKISSHANNLICFTPARASLVIDTRLSLASMSFCEYAPILTAIHRLMGIKATPNTTPAMNAAPICVYSKYSVMNS